MPRPLPAVAAMMPATCVPCPTKSLSEPPRKFLYSRDHVLQVGMARVDAAVDDGDGDIRGVLESRGARAWPSRIAPWPHCREASGSAPAFARRANSVRTGGTNAYSTSFMRATCAASCDGLVPLLTLSSTRRGDRALAGRPAPPRRRTSNDARCSARALVEDVLDARDAAVVQQAGQPESGVTPAARAARPPADIDAAACGLAPLHRDATLAMTVRSDFFGGSTSCCHRRYCSGFFAILPHSSPGPTELMYRVRDTFEG